MSEHGARQPDDLNVDLNDDLTLVTRARLERLAAMPVDTSRLERRLSAALGAGAAPPARSLRVIWTRRAAAAAVLLLALMAAHMVERSAGPALAEPFELTDLHQRLVRGESAMLAAADVEEANRRIAAQSADGPAVPGLAATRRLYVRSCCLAEVRGPLVAAVLMVDEGRAVTLVVAQARDFAGPMGEVIERDGRELLAHRLNDLEMVVTRRGDRWLCVMGQADEVDPQRLAAIAAGIVF